MANLIFKDSDKSLYFTNTGIRTPYVSPDPVDYDGLILYVDAANTSSYPGTGDIWYDLSSYHNNGTLSGCSFVDNSFLLTRSKREQIDFGSGAEWGFTERWTYIAWIKPILTSNLYVFQKLPYDNLALIWGFQAGSTNIWNGSYHPDANSPKLPLNHNTWGNVVYTKGANGTSNNWRGYMNGSEIFKLSTNFSVNSSTQGFNIGRDAMGDYTSLGISRILVYNKDVSAEYVQNIYNYFS